MDIKSKFKISGKVRRQLKKELSSLKHFVRDFWYWHQMDKDMSSFYGSTASQQPSCTDTFPMSDEDAKVMYNVRLEEINEIKTKLKEEL